MTDREFAKVLVSCMDKAMLICFEYCMLHKEDFMYYLKDRLPDYDDKID